MVGAPARHLLRSDLAVVFVTLDREALLRSVVRQLAEQPTLPGECIVIDQGTPGEKEDVLAPLAELGVRCRYLYSSYRSISAARNVGMENAGRAEIILYLDDDVDLMGDVVAGHASYYDAEPETVALAGHVACLPLGADYERLNTFRPTGELVAQGRGCHMSFRQRVLREVGGFNAYIAHSGDETELYRRLRKRGYTIRNGERVLVRHLVALKGGNRQAAVWSHAHYVRALRDGVVRAAKDKGYVASLFWPIKNAATAHGLIRTSTSTWRGVWTLLREIPRAYRLAWLSCRTRNYIPLSVRLSRGVGLDGRTGLPTG